MVQSRPQQCKRLGKPSVVKNAAHTLSYSLIGLQEMNLAYKYPTIYWDCANLIVDAGGSAEIEESTTNYDKIAEAVNKIKTTTSVNIGTIDINKSQIDFSPDMVNSQILYGLSALNGVNKDISREIIANRPYSSFKDFLDKTSANRTAIISLIKAGAFDCFDDRKKIMYQYMEEIGGKKEKVNLQNFNALLTYGLIPNELQYQKQLFVFNKALRQMKTGDCFDITKPNFNKFYMNHFDENELEVLSNGGVGINQKKWKKMYDKDMLPAKEYLKEHQEEMVAALNKAQTKEMWLQYAQGNLSYWEMTALGFYAHQHELININYQRYDLVAYKDLPYDPEPISYFRNKYPLYSPVQVCGTIIAKDDLHKCISLLTIDSGVITVKMPQDYYAEMNRRVAKVLPNGKKEFIEDSWFKRGTKVICGGYRRQDQFYLKTYKKTPFHKLTKIEKINPDGSLVVQTERIGAE